MDDSEKSGEIQSAGGGRRGATAIASDQKTAFVGKLEFFLTTLVGTMLWAYAFVNIFVINTDPLIKSSIPAELGWLVDFKFVLILVIIAVTWLILGTGQFVISFICVTLFPLVAVAFASWKSGKYVFNTRSWIIVLAALEMLTSSFSRFKLKFASAVAFVVCATYLIVGNSGTLLSISSAVILFIILSSYVRAFLSAISPPNIFRLTSNFFEHDRVGKFKLLRLDDDLNDKPLATLSSTEIEKWNNALQNTIIYNRAMLFYARAMRDYQKSNLLFMPGIFSIFRLTVFTVLGFALVNFGLYKCDPSYYKVVPGSGLFKFFYYSFNSLVLNGIDDIKPVKDLSQMVLMLQELLSFVLALILVSLFISYRTQRASSELDRAIKVAEREAASTESWLREQFKMANIAKAIDHLIEAESSFINFIHWLSKGI